MNMDGIGSGFVGYSIPGVPASLKEWIRPSLRYDLSNSTCHVNPPGGEMMSDHYGCRVGLPPGGGDTDEYTDAVRQWDMLYLVCRASRHPYIRSWGDAGLHHTYCALYSSMCL